MVATNDTESIQCLEITDHTTATQCLVPTNHTETTQRLVSMNHTKSTQCLISTDCTEFTECLVSTDNTKSTNSFNRTHSSQHYSLWRFSTLFKLTHVEHAPQKSLYIVVLITRRTSRLKMTWSYFVHLL